MSCRQFFPVRLAQGATATRYIGIAGDGFAWLSTAPPTGGTICRWAGEWQNFIFQHLTAPGSGKTFVYTLVKNGVDTAVVITIADLAVEGRSTAAVTAVSGDQFYWRRDTTGTPTLSGVRYIAEFSHSTDNLNGYHGYDGISNSSTFRAPLFSPSTWTGGIAANNNSVVAVPGNLTELYYKLDQAPGSGKSYVFGLEIDGVLQDGSGATTDTRVTIADAATSGSWSGSIPLTAGQYCALQEVPSGTPSVVVASIAVTFEPTTDGESNLSGTIQENLPATGTRYLFPAQTFGTSMSTTEADCDVIGGITDFELRRFYIRLGLGAVGTGPIDFTTRQNGAGGSLAITMTVGEQAESDTSGTMTISDGDTWTLEYVATGSPGATRIASQSWALYALGQPATKRVFIFGKSGKTTSTPTVLFNLDNVTRSVDLPESHAIGGNLALIEHATGPSGTANVAKIFAIDNGAGKTRLMVQFGTGTPIQIAIEA